MAYPGLPKQPKRPNSGVDSRRSLWRSPQTWIFGSVILLVGYLSISPLIFLLYQSFRTPQTPTRPGNWSLVNYTTILTDFQSVELLRNTVVFAVGAALVAVIVGSALAWINERTNTPFRSLFFSLSLVPMVMPGLLFTISWVYLLSKDIGLINLVLMNLFGLKKAPFDIYSMWGMIWVEGLVLSPLAFLMVSTTFRALDPSLEESARMSGAGTWAILRRITLRLAWPGIFGVILITFARGIEAFEVPAVLGLPVGIKVFTSEIYQAMGRYPADTGISSTYAIGLLLMASTGAFVNSRIIRDQSRYATVTGKGFRPRIMDLGPWRYFTAGVYVLYVLVVTILPLFILLWASLQPFYQIPSLADLGNISLKNYAYVITYPKAMRSFANSLWLAAATGFIAMFLTAILAWMSLRFKSRHRWILDQIAFLPILFPGLILALAIMIIYLRVPLPIYGTVWILLIAYVTMALPYGMRYNMASLIQIQRDLEESAQMSGATWWEQFRLVTLPLIKPGLIAGWIAIVVVAVRVLSVSVLLYSPGSDVLPVTSWELWKNGQGSEVAALGVILTVMLLLISGFTHRLSNRFGIKE